MTGRKAVERVAEAARLLPFNMQGAEQAALLALFFLAGVIGHDPWKQDETYTFGIVSHFLSTHSWLVPVDAGTPFMEKPPLYYWTAVVFCKLFGGVLALPDAARLASVFYAAIAFVFTWRLSDVVFAERADRRTLRWLTLALLFGSAGIIRHVHDMFSDVALLAGTTVALYGMALLFVARDDWRRAGVWTGLGVGIAFLSKGFFTPVALAAAAAIVYAIVPETRRRESWFAAAVAFAAASPFLFAWPTLLYLHSEPLFMQWFWDNNIGRFLGFSVSRLGADNPPFYIWKVAPLFAFPAFPMACAAIIIRTRNNWRNPAFLLPAAVGGVALLLRTFSATARALYLIPFVPAFALLAAPLVAGLPARFHARLNLAFRALVAVALAALWTTWGSISGTFRARPVAWLQDIYERWLPTDAPSIAGQHLALAAAVALTCLWLASLRFEKSSPASTARIWLAGVAAVWGVAFTILLPWMNETRSYQEPMRKIVLESGKTVYGKGCIGMTRFDESVSPLIDFYTHRYRAVQTFDQSGCPILVELDAKEAPLADHPRWRLVWRGRRPLDAKDQELRLYVESTPPELDRDGDGDVDGAGDKGDVDGDDAPRPAEAGTRGPISVAAVKPAGKPAAPQAALMRFGTAKM